jgi:hypothetical protein
MKDINTLYQKYLQPSAALVSEIGALDGDILILGVGGGKWARVLQSLLSEH